MPPVRKAKGVNQLYSIARTKAMSQQDDEDHDKDLSHGGVLVLQVGVSTLTDGGSDLLHGVVALGEGQDLLPLQEAKSKAATAPTSPIQKQLSKTCTLLFTYFFRFLPALKG